MEKEHALNTFSYQIGDKKFYQKALVLGQLEALGKELEGTTFALSGTDDESIKSLSSSLLELFKTGKLIRAMAIVLIPDGVLIKDKNLEEIADHLRAECDLAMGAKIITDFFICNDVSSIFSNVKLPVGDSKKKLPLKNLTG